MTALRMVIVAHQGWRRLSLIEQPVNRVEGERERVRGHAVVAAVVEQGDQLVASSGIIANAVLSDERCARPLRTGRRDGNHALPGTGPRYRSVGERNADSRGPRRYDGRRTAERAVAVDEHQRCRVHQVVSGTVMPL